jgi:peptidylprolyl isomerase
MMLKTAFAGVLLLSAAAPAGAAEGWRRLDPAATLVIETTKGRVVVELRPDLAPIGVTRVVTLTRSHVYDGLQFHRVIDNFVAQTGNPNNHDGGQSGLPDLAPEFFFPRAAGSWVPATDASDGISGFVGSLAIAGEPVASIAVRPDHRLRAWGAYCPGTLGMGRQEAKDTANSELFFMRTPSRRLDRDYTAIGRVVIGLDVIRALAVGEPPRNPDRMLKVQILADLPEAERPVIEVPDDASLHARIAAARAAKGADFSVCDVEVMGRETGVVK